MRWNLMIGIVAFSLVFPACKEDNKMTRPEITVKTVTVPEGTDQQQTAELMVSLSQPATEDIMLIYSTQDNTAVEGQDYVAVNMGSTMINAGSATGTISLTIIPDDLLEFTEEFLVVLQEPDNALLVFSSIPVKIEDDDDFTPGRDADGYVTPASYPGLDLVWADEFDGPSINGEYWNFELGDGCPNLCGWGNNELQQYSDVENNVKIENGKLIVTAIKKEGYDEYTSARIITKGKKEFTFGRIDIRARLPFGRGIWPAIWMLGSNIDQVGWPVCGEIDIMELVGHEPSVTHGTAHYDVNGWQSKGTSYYLSGNETFADEFHIFSILWEKNNIKWYVDYNPFFELSVESVGSTYPFNSSFFFILNVAVGGNWPGDPDETTVFPQTMEVDYIRVFQQE